MKKKIRSIIISTVVILLLLGLAIYATISATHGIVLFDIFFYKNVKINTDLSDKVRIIGEITPRLTQGNTAGDYPASFRQPEFKESVHFSLFSRAKCRGADARISIVSRDKIASAYIREVVVIDARGETRMPYYQNRELSDERKYKNTSSFSDPYFSWHGIYTEGNGLIEVSGHVIMNAGNERIEFQKSIPIECLKIQKIMTRKRWNEFFVF